MKTADPEFMRVINRFYGMNAIRRFGFLSRVEIADHADLSSPTGAAITAALIDGELFRGAAAMTLHELYSAPWNTTGPARLQ